MALKAKNSSATRVNSRPSLEIAASQSHAVLYYDESNQTTEIFVNGLPVFGFTIRKVDNEEQFINGALSGWYETLIVRIRGNHSKLLKLIAKITIDMRCPPVLLISDNSSMAHRLQAIKAGVKGFSLAPTDIIEVIEQLELIQFNHVDVESSIVIYEPNQTMADYYRAIVEVQGMTVRFTDDWTRLLDVIAEHRPDALILPTKLDKIEVADLVKVIRMDKTNDSLPLIAIHYGYPNPDRGNQLKILGVDDVIDAPISPTRFLETLLFRLTRFRRIRSGLSRDSLTGLLNHKMLIEQLHLEFSRAKRANRPMCYALADLDNFKQVNDNFGHGMGDKVLQFLSHLLRQRLRRTDYVGRYGGEEFGVILSATNEQNALKVMEEVREQFAKTIFENQKDKFSVTMSIGLVSSPYFDSVTDLAVAADKSLYEAKNRGRNCTVVGPVTGQSTLNRIS